MIVYPSFSPFEFNNYGLINAYQQLDMDSYESMWIRFGLVIFGFVIGSALLITAWVLREVSSIKL
jgi:hypothetical protein